MIRQAVICTSITCAIAILPVAAQQVSSPNAVATDSVQKRLIPGTDYELVFGSVMFSPPDNHAANVLLATLTLWTAKQSGLPESPELPKLVFVTPAKMADVRYKGLLGANVTRTRSVGNTAPRETVAVYDDATKTIYLREGWTGQTPAELSILVHELVHHLQNLGRIKHECPQERERVAYRVQNQWLWLFDSDLERAFDIDPMTLLATTTCGY